MRGLILILIGAIAGLVVGSPVGVFVNAWVSHSRFSKLEEYRKSFAMTPVVVANVDLRPGDVATLDQIAQHDLLTRFATQAGHSNT